MDSGNKKWIYLIVLSVIWGTSYILIKKGLLGFSPLQLGAVRILIAGVLLFAIGYRSVRGINRAQWQWVALSGFLGSFFPMFLFAFAEAEIDSSVAAILNSLVPLFTLLLGVLFGIRFSKNQLSGVLLGLLGASLLIVFGKGVNPDQNYWYSGLVVLAAIGYACNANIIKNKLQDVGPMGIAVGNFATIMVPGLLVLFFSGFFAKEVFYGPHFVSALGYVVLLCIVGTCIAKVLFNKLVQVSSAVFSVSVAYLIPIVGVFWGVLDGEQFTLEQALSALLILLGVYLIHKKRRP